MAKQIWGRRSAMMFFTARLPWGLFGSMLFLLLKLLFYYSSWSSPGLQPISVGRWEIVQCVIFSCIVNNLEVHGPFHAPVGSTVVLQVELLFSGFNPKFWSCSGEVCTCDCKDFHLMFGFPPMSKGSAHWQINWWFKNGHCVVWCRKNWRKIISMWNSIYYKEQSGANRNALGAGMDMLDQMVSFCITSKCN